MTIDAHGRKHHATGSPAGIGGQYAQQPAPAAAAALAPKDVSADRLAETKRHLGRLREQQERLASIIREEQAAAILDRLAETGQTELIAIATPAQGISVARPYGEGPNDLGIDQAFLDRTGCMKEAGVYVVPVARLREMAGNAGSADLDARADQRVYAAAQLRRDASAAAAEAARSVVTSRIRAAHPDAAAIAVDRDVDEHGAGYAAVELLDAHGDRIDDASDDLIDLVEGEHGIRSHLNTIAVDDLTNANQLRSTVEL